MIVERKDIGGLLAKLAELQKQRSMLETQKYKAKGNEIISGALNAVESKVSSIAGRFARAYETSEKRKEEVDNYRNALESVNSEYGKMVAEIKGQMLECDDKEKKALLTLAIENKAMRETAKSVRKQLRDNRGPSKDVGAEQDLDQLEEQLNQRLAQIEQAKERSGKSKEKAREVVLDARTKRVELAERLKSVQNERNEKLQSLAEDRQVVKQTPLSRFFGMFGRNAKNRVESIEKSMNDRTAHAIDEQRRIRAEIESNAEARVQASKEIVGSLRDKFAEYSEMASATIETCKDVVTGKAKDMLEFAKDSVENVRLQTKGFLQKSIRGMLDGLNKYADGLEETQEQQKALKERMDARAKKDVEAHEM